MSQAAEKEPTMEEILASIRRIISEDGDADAGKSPPAEVEDAVANEVDEEEEEDILELTDRIEEESEPEPEPEIAEESEPEPVFTAQTVFEEPETAPFDETVDKNALVSEMTEKVSGASFAELSAMMVGGYEGAGNTLEGLVREMLKPMLRAWLDDNLPRIVEDMVEREVARIASRGRHR